jgi:hypothetical protein
MLPIDHEKQNAKLQEIMSHLKSDEEENKD